MQQVINYILLHDASVIAAFFASFAAGFLISMSAIGINREGRKKGYRSGRFVGKDREIDKQMLREYKDGAGISSYLQDDQEHHASKKFK